MTFPAAGRRPAAALFFLAAGLGAKLFALSSPFSAHDLWLAGLLLVGLPVLWRTGRGVIRGRWAADLVAALAILFAMVLRQPFAGLVIVLMQTGGEALEAYAVGRASAAVRQLEAAAPRIAHRLIGEAVQDVPVGEIVPGDLLLVRAGEMIPCDGTVTAGESAVDVARITGEPIPISARPGTSLLSGALNLHGPLTLTVRAPARESLYARIVELVRHAQASKAPVQRLADRYAIWFTPITLAVCLVAWAASRDPLRVLAVLVVATPCPMLLATPVAIVGGINRAARQHLIVRSGGALERLGDVTRVVLDKTGTLTLGRPAVEEVVPCGAWDAERLLAFAAAVEDGAGHPLAQSITAARAHRGLPRLQAHAVREHPGAGVVGDVEGHAVLVGAWSLLDRLHPDWRCPQGEVCRRAGAAALQAVIAIDGVPHGVIRFADAVRDDAAPALRRLAALGLRDPILLSGDSRANVQAVAEALGVGDARSGLLPDEKLQAVRDLEGAGTRVLMVGDGTNDAPALSAATVGIALGGGAGGSAGAGGISTEAADVVLLADDLRLVPAAVEIGRRTVRIARQSLWVGLGLSTVAMAFAAAGKIPPVAGALLQEGVDVAVIVNALRAALPPGWKPSHEL